LDDITENGHQEEDQEGIGFVTTSFILLVMVAAATTTASLQQEDNYDETETSAAVVNVTIDDPFIPIGPAEEDSPKVIQLQYLSSFFFTFQV
jgi:hypothetical protein